MRILVQRQAKGECVAFELACIVTRQKAASEGMKANPPNTSFD